MECLTEFACSVYVDGELTEAEFRQVEEHLESCKACRAMSAAFREENRLLIACIQEIDSPDPGNAAVQNLNLSTVSQPGQTERNATPADILKGSGILIGVAVLLRIAMSSPEKLSRSSVPVNLDWLDPSNLAGRINWLIGTIAYLAEEGATRMSSLMDSLSFITLFVLIFAGAVVLVRRSLGKGAMVASLGLLLMVVSATPGFAMDVRAVGQDKVMTLPANETVDDNLFAAGETVIIDGTVEGDLIAFARRVTINGTVKGNVITGASTIEVLGTVEGTIIGGGQTIQIGGKVGRNIVGFGQSVTIGKDATVGGDAVGFGSETHLNGTVAHSFYAIGMADVAGSVGRNVNFRGANFSVLPSARISGNLKAHVPKAENVHIDPAAMIGGTQSIELPKPSPSKYTTFGFYFGQLIHVAAAFIAGILLLLILPRLRSTGFSDVVSILKSGGIGFLLVFSAPIAALIVAITLVGLPVAFVLFVTWLVGLYLAKIVLANFIGRTLLSSSGERMSSVALALLVGLVLIFIAINLPYIGGMIHFVLVLVGFGTLAMNVYGSLQAAHGSGR